MEILDPNHKYAIWTSKTTEILHLEDASSQLTLRSVVRDDNIQYNTSFNDIFIKYEDAMFLYNTKDEDILRLFIISLINKIKNNDYKI